MSDRGLSAVRQLWVDGTERQCEHKRQDKILSEGGEVIAALCRDCGVRIAERGPCPGCEKDGCWLTKFTGTSKIRGFCSGLCETAFNEAEKARRKAPGAKK